MGPLLAFARPKDSAAPISRSPIKRLAAARVTAEVPVFPQAVWLLSRDARQPGHKCTRDFKTAQCPLTQRHLRLRAVGSRR